VYVGRRNGVSFSHIGSVSNRIVLWTLIGLLKGLIKSIGFKMYFAYPAHILIFISDEVAEIYPFVFEIPITASVQSNPVHAP
jgi:hypothetical protein